MIQVIKGDFAYAQSLTELKTYEDGYMIVVDGIIEEIYSVVPKKYKDIVVTDYTGHLVIPGFSDIHVHAPQHVQRGIGFDEELLPWLEKYTFPLEARYTHVLFAETSYKAFINDLWAGGTLRASIFGTMHKQSTKKLCMLLEESGLKGYVGKVNMDRNASCELQEDTECSIRETIELIEEITNECSNVKYIVTPRFVPSTTEKMMKELGKLVEQYKLPVQSHLSENRSEVEWVKKLHPTISTFTEVYNEYGLLPINRTIMAHCIYLSQKELDILRRKKILLAHCAQSNKNLASGIMAARKYLDEGLKVGIASDVGVDKIKGKYI